MKKVQVLCAKDEALFLGQNFRGDYESRFQLIYDFCIGCYHNLYIDIRGT